MEQTYFRKGFGLKAEVRPIIDAEYHSAIVERIRSRGYEDTLGDIHVRLAQEFGFCYGVDRAVDYAYETVRKFPDKTIYLVGEIIHNPHVNKRMTEMGIEFIYPIGEGQFDFSHVTPEEAPCTSERTDGLGNIFLVAYCVVDLDIDLAKPIEFAKSDSKRESVGKYREAPPARVSCRILHQ